MSKTVGEDAQGRIRELYVEWFALLPITAVEAELLGMVRMHEDQVQRLLTEPDPDGCIYEQVEMCEEIVLNILRRRLRKAPITHQQYRTAIDVKG